MSKQSSYLHFIFLVLVQIIGLDKIHAQSDSTNKEEQTQKAQKESEEDRKKSEREKMAEKINDMIVTSLNLKDQKKLYKVQYSYIARKALPHVIRDKQLTDKTIKNIVGGYQQHMEFFLRNMHIRYIFAIAMRYGLTEIVDELEKHPEYCQGQFCVPDYERKHDRLYIGLTDIEDIYNNTNLLSKHGTERLCKAYVKGINVSLRNAIKAKDKKAVNGFFMKLECFSDEFSKRYMREKFTYTNYPTSYTYSNPRYIVHYAWEAGSIDEIFEKETMEVIYDNMEFCLENMDPRTIEVFVELSEKFRKKAYKNKHALRKRHIRDFNICGRFGGYKNNATTGYAKQMFAEEMIDRLCEAVRKKDPSIFPYQDSIFSECRPDMPYFKPKITRKQLTLLKKNIGYMFFQKYGWRSVLNALKSYDIFTQEEMAKSIVQYVTTKPDLSHADYEFTEAYRLCSIDKALQDKLLKEMPEKYRKEIIEGEERLRWLIENEGSLSWVDRLELKNKLDFTQYRSQSDIPKCIQKLLKDNIGEFGNYFLARLLDQDSFRSLCDELCAIDMEFKLLVYSARIIRNIDNLGAIEKILADISSDDYAKLMCFYCHGYLFEKIMSDCVRGDVLGKILDKMSDKDLMTVMKHGDKYSSIICSVTCFNDNDISVPKLYERLNKLSDDDLLALMKNYVLRDFLCGNETKAWYVMKELHRIIQFIKPKINVIKRLFDEITGDKFVSALIQWASEVIIFVRLLELGDDIVAMVINKLDDKGLVKILRDNYMYGDKTTVFYNLMAGNNTVAQKIILDRLLKDVDKFKPLIDNVEVDQKREIYSRPINHKNREKLISAALTTVHDLCNNNEIRKHVKGVSERYGVVV